MFNGFIVLILGLFLIFLSYVTLKLGSSIKDTDYKSKEELKKEVQNGTGKDFGMEETQILRYVMFSVFSFVIGILLVLGGIASISGLITIQAVK